MSKSLPLRTANAVATRSAVASRRSAAASASATLPLLTNRWQAHRPLCSSCRRHQQGRHADEAALVEEDRPAPESAQQEELSASDKLMRDAQLGEAEEARIMRKRADLDRKMSGTDPIWDGDELVEHTILRMLMDKHKPLRTGSSDPLTDKMKTVQKPTERGVIASEALSFSSELGVATGAPKPASDDGRRLAKTPDNQPWAAVYVRPSHASGKHAHVHYGKHMDSVSSSGVAASSLTRRLMAAGISPSQIPRGDPKAMRLLREGVRKLERAGKLAAAREGVLDYKIGLTKGGPKSGAEGAEDGTPDYNTHRNQRRRAPIPMGTKMWATLVDERIEAAMKEGLFKNNKLRGKPLARDVNERNPYLGREEFLMNRIVKRQGAAPPWVELNMELESELSSFRSRLRSSWVRRASRMICSCSLKDGLEPLPPQAAETTVESDSRPSSTEAEMAVVSELLDADTPAADLPLAPPGSSSEDAVTVSPPLPSTHSAGQRRLLEVAQSYRDGDWEAREATFHEVELTALNNKLRRYNTIAPYTARRPYLTREMELDRLYRSAVPALVDAISDTLRPKARPASSNTDRRGAPKGAVDIWGRPVAEPSSAGSVEPQESTYDSALQRGYSSGDSSGGGQPQQLRRGRMEGQPSALGFGVVVRKTLQWAKERAGM